MPALYKRG